jgi:hypothetical protein
MKGTLFVILAIFFPWVIFLCEEKPGLAFCSMVCQVTIIAWLPMTMLAFKHRDNISYFEKKTKHTKATKKVE